jgi:dihydroxyacetone kinase DhaKLM complex PTS-EIIA-like component DhaM
MEEVRIQRVKMGQLQRQLWEIPVAIARQANFTKIYIISDFGSSTLNFNTPFTFLAIFAWA